MASSGVSRETLSLEAVHLGVTFGSKVALADVSATFARGTLTALVGPNGSGKSTLLRCLGGILRPGKGVVRVDGVVLGEREARTAARSIAYVPQETPTPFAFTVEELVGLAPGEGKRTREEALAAMEAMEIDALRGRALTTLSGGERQRAAVARGLAQTAAYLLLDEPTAHLDPRHQVHLFQVLRRRADEGTGIVVVLHDLSTAARWADWAILLNSGRVRAAGTIAETFTPERLSGVYETPVVVVQTVDGGLVVDVMPRAETPMI